MLSHLSLVGSQVSQYLWPVANGPFEYDSLPAPRAKQAQNLFVELTAEAGPEDIPIRLLEVLPTQQGGRIHVQIRQGNSFDEKYRCLSYVWGDSSQKSHTISLNGY